MCASAVSTGSKALTNQQLAQLLAEEEAQWKAQQAQAEQALQEALKQEAENQALDLLAHFAKNPVLVQDVPVTFQPRTLAPVVPFDSCAGITCSGHGVCEAGSDGQARCQCSPGSFCGLHAAHRTPCKWPDCRLVSKRLRCNTAAIVNRRQHIRMRWPSVCYG